MRSLKLGNAVAQRAALHAEGDPAVHATSRLVGDLLVALGLVDLAPVAQAHRDRSVPGSLAGVLEKAGDLTHP